MTALAPRTRSLYEMVGSEQGLDQLVQAFYDIIEQDPEAHELHLLHLRGHGVAHSRIEQFDYLSGFLGGPRHYLQRHGHTRLREIHEYIPIDQKMRDVWLDCMRKAIVRTAIPAETADVLMAHLTHAADTTINM
ncbi:group II truncated hemoglobin [Mesorhizobium sp. A623]